MPDKNIIIVELDTIKDLCYRNTPVLVEYVRKRVKSEGVNFNLFVDEIQMADVVPNPFNKEVAPVTFYDALNDLKEIVNLDIYILLVVILKCCLRIYSLSFG